ncbi:MAG: orotidine 5'-phosphate decarboxylase [Oligoflexales bacterium]|nr:orotidine 5'-phosphate decarboxylase [Oligoflexales bacterium]
MSNMRKMSSPSIVPPAQLSQTQGQQLLETKRLSYAERSQHIAHPLASKILRLMARKKTNLALSLDLPQKELWLDLAEKIGPHICMLKTHVDVLEEYDPSIGLKLAEIAQRHEFVILEDRKLSESGQTLLHQYHGGPYKISSWAELVSVHAMASLETFDTLSGNLKGVDERGVFLSDDTPAKSSFFDTLLQEKLAETACQNVGFIVGFITRKRLMNSHLISMYPETTLESSSVHSHPDFVFSQLQSDIMLAGPSIYSSENPLYLAQTFRELAWDAYERSLF